MRGNVAKEGERRCEAAITNYNNKRHGERCLAKAMPGKELCISHWTNGYVQSSDGIDPITEKISERARAILAAEKEDREIMQEKLEKTREGLTLHFTITARLPINPDDPDSPPGVTEVDGYVTTGIYADGRLGEVFIRVSKELASMGPVLDQWAIAVSTALQCGAPLEVFLRKFVGARFEPSGAVTGVTGITKCTSPIDLIARWLIGKYGMGK